MVLRCGKAYSDLGDINGPCARRRMAGSPRKLDLEDLEMTLTRWPPEADAETEPWPHPPMATAIGRGLLGRCPACGKAHLFNGFLRVVPQCRNCGAPLGLARADDAPPYFTILITGHIVVPLLLSSIVWESPPSG